jgi:hypothetical protein
MMFHALHSPLSSTAMLTGPGFPQHQAESGGPASPHIVIRDHHGAVGPRYRVGGAVA